MNTIMINVIYEFWSNLSCYTPDFLRKGMEMNFAPNNLFKKIKIITLLVSWGNIGFLI